MRTTLIIIAFLIIASCKKKDSSIAKIDSDVNLDLHENVYNGKRSFILRFETTKHYGCCNYSFDFKSKVTEDKIQVDLNNIIMPDFCLTAIGPAYTEIEFNSVSNREIELTVELKRKKVKGLIKITDGQYKLDLNNSNGLIINKSTFNRIPNGTIWGNVGYHKDTSKYIAEQFVDSLMLIGASSRTNLTGDYYYFRVDNSGALLLKSTGHYFDKTFFLNYSVDQNQISRLIDRYEKRYKGDLYIYVHNDLGVYL